MNDSISIMGAHTSWTPPTDTAYGIMVDTTYGAYVAECNAENLEPHTFTMWAVHGRPTGPLG